jgi:hypothetical protein
MVPFNLVDTAEKMKSGELDAVVRIGGKPISDAGKMYAANKNLKLLEVSFTDAWVIPPPSILSRRTIQACLRSTGDWIRSRSVSYSLLATGE